MIEDIIEDIKKLKISIDDSKNNEKQQIIDLFMNNVKNKTINLPSSKHCGKEGHWLEKQMGIKHNCRKEPDINGYEMKKYSKKITFGDISATEYIYSNNKPFINNYNKWINNTVNMSRTEFICYFGTFKKEKNRYSWSGKCVPVYDKWNECGQILTISSTNDICIYYSYSKDTREVKSSFPEYLKEDNILIVIWKDKIRQHINKKFNNNGFFLCKKNKDTYSKICFGKPFNFDYFIQNIKNKTIIFDSGMYEGNNRNYSQFRSISDRFWEQLITEEF